MSRREYNNLSREVIRCAIEVHKGLGPGLLERVYEDALSYEMAQSGLQVERQAPIDVKYKELEIRNGYFADVIVNNMLILELKAVEQVLPVHKAQLLSYLKLADKKLGLLLNFHVKKMTDGISRIINGRL
jgi:GxxExxY protein